MIVLENLQFFLLAPFLIGVKHYEIRQYAI